MPVVPAELPDPLTASMMILSALIGIFGALFIYAYIFSSGEDADESFRQAAEYRPFGNYSWGYFKVMLWLGVSAGIGVVAFHALMALVNFIKAKL